MSKNVNIIKWIRNQAMRSQNQDNGKPSFAIVVPPSVFTVPQGWEFVLSQPFEGVSYIATVLHNAGYPVRIIDVREAEQPLKEAIAQMINFKPDILGIATYEDGLPFIKELCQLAKEECPELHIILGGSLVTSTPLAVMENTLADIAVLGEGEQTILELMDLISNKDIAEINKIAGLCYKDNSGKLIFTDKRPQMKDLNSLPTMNLSLWPKVRKNPKIKEILFSHSRGCYMNCSFCYRTTPQLSLKSVDKVRQELRELKAKHDFEFIYFVDLTFAIDKKRTLEICKVVKEFNVRWSCMSRVQNLDKEMLEAMKGAGCQIILYGFESLDQDVLDKAHKGITPAEIKRMLTLTRDCGIQTGGLFILGLPGETKSSIKKVIDFIKETNGACRVKYLSAIPGTEIYRSAIKKGIIKNEIAHLNWLAKETGQINDEFLNFTELTDEELRSAYKAISAMYIKGPQFYEAWS